MKKYFGTDGIRGRVGDDKINPEFMLRLGWAVGRVLAQDQHAKVVIGKDTRISGYMLESALEAGLSAAGVDVLLLGPVPTPAVAYLTRTFRASAGIAISASHNPFYDNGVKFFYGNGMKLSDELEFAIEEKLTQPLQVVPSSDLGRASRVKDAAGRYIEFCKSTFPNQLSLSGLKIVVDCAHGAAYDIAKKVFHELGAEVEAIGVSPDGLNINLERGATDTRALKAAVKLHKADIGVALDGDADRCMLVDENGVEVDGDEILAILIDSYMNEKKIKPLAVVGTLMTNLGLEQMLTKRDIELLRVKVGDRYVMEKLLQEELLFGGESSGHIVNMGKTTTGDGIITALGVLRAMQFSEKSVSELKSVMTKCPQKMINVPVRTKFILDQYPDVQQVITEAEKSLGSQGRILVRASGTEPLVRVMVEAQAMEMAETVAKQVAAVIDQVVA